MFNKIVSTKNNLSKVMDILSAIKNCSNPYLTDEYKEKIFLSVEEINIAAETFLKRLSLTVPCQQD
jgi:hypothetical protein